MNYNSKVYILGIFISAVVGWFITGSVLAIFLISLLWHFLFRSSDQVISEDININYEQMSDSQTNPLKCIVNIAIIMLNIKENIDKRDLEKIEEYFVKSKGFGQYELKTLKMLIFQSINDYNNMDTTVHTQIINRYYSYEEKLSIIELLFSLLETEISPNYKASHHIFKKQEHIDKQTNYIFQIAQKLEIIHSDYYKIKSKFAKNDITQYYEALNLSPTATLEEVKTKYRELAMELHPDKNQGADNSKEFQKIAQAYKEILKNK